MVTAFHLKRLVQSKQNGRYYAGGGLWVDGVEEAKDFRSTVEVLEEMRQGAWERDCCDLVLRLDEHEGWDTRLSL